MMAPMWPWRVMLVVSGMALVADARGARACSPPQAAAPTAIPRNGTTGVSTATSIIVVSPTEPFGVSVLAGGQASAVSGWSALGSGIDGTSGPTTFWELSLGMLSPSTDYVVTAPPGADGGSTVLTRFSTAAGYDKTPGTAANLRSVQLWRVRYPVADIASGNCVFAEYAGFVTVDYDPATLPNTAPGSVVQTFQLRPETGGTTQRFVYTGDAPFTGLAPAGDYPLPLGAWQPELDPTRRYCLSVSAIGDGNLANLGAGSNQICADVVQLSAKGAPPPPGTGASSGSSGGGCSTSGMPSGWMGLTLIAAAGLGAAVRAGRGRRARRRR